MPYKALSKLYYEDRGLYIEEYQTRIKSQDSILLDFKIKGKQAFFVQTSEVLNLIIQIYKTDKKIYAMSRSLPGVAINQFTKRCLIDEILLTNKIEGVYSTRKEIASVLNDLEDTIKKQKKRKRFDGLIAQYAKLKEKESIPLQTCVDIRKLYDDIVLQEVLEEDSDNAPDGKIFRKEMSTIRTATDKEIHRGTYPESAICEEMEKALAFLRNEDIEILFRISIFHYLLEYIHPFYDGNGRLGRFIISYLLAQNLSPLLAYRISFTITENLNQYYNAFKTCNDAHNLGDVTPFVYMMLNMIKESTAQLENALQTRVTRLNRYKDYINKLPNGTAKRTYRVYFVLIQAGLFSEDGISTHELMNFLKSSYNTAKSELDSINETGLLIKNKVGRECCYMLDLEKLDTIQIEKSSPKP